MTKQAEALRLARDNGYVIARHNAAGRSLAALWWTECEARRLPYVRVTPRITRAYVEMDMLPAEHRLSKAAKDAIDAAIMKVWDSLPMATKGVYVWGNYTGVGCIPVAQASELATELRAIAVADMQ